MFVVHDRDGARQTIEGAHIDVEPASQITAHMGEIDERFTLLLAALLAVPADEAVG